MRSALLLVMLCSCTELKNQARLGLGGTGSAYAPGHQPDLGSGPTMAGGSAAMSVGQAVGAAAASRALGGCYSSCPAGTGCNAATGFCEALPCRGMCAADETCQNDRCVPALLPGLVIDQKQ